MKSFARLMAAAMFLFVGALPSSAWTHVVQGGEAYGGRTVEFLHRVAFFERNRVKVMLREDCWSSCTFYLKLLRQNLLCAKPGTKMVFHQFFWATDLVSDAQGNLMSFKVARVYTGATAARYWLQYPAAARSVILRHSPRGLPPPGKELFIPAKAFGVPEC